MEVLFGHLERVQPLVTRLIAIIMDQGQATAGPGLLLQDEQAERLLWRVIKQGEEQERVDLDLLLLIYDNLTNFYTA